MRFWSIFFFTAFLSPVNAIDVLEIIDVSDKVSEPFTSITRIDLSVQSEEDQSIEGAISSFRDAEASLLYVRDPEDSFVYSRDAEVYVLLITGEKSTTPAANTPGGGVLRLTEDLPPFPPEKKWWEQWWEAVVNFFG